MILHFLALLAASSAPNAASTADASSASKEKLICTRNAQTGSRLRAKRVCKTKEQHEADAEEMRQAMEKERFSNGRIMQ